MDLKSVDDANDFSVPALSFLDATLRCPICQELYTAPVITKCSHSFCSKCIMSSFSLGNPTCPTCFVEASEGQLKKNAALADVVEAWMKARPALLALQSYADVAGNPPKAPPALSSTHRQAHASTSASALSSDNDDESGVRAKRAPSTRSQTTRASAAVGSEAKGKGKARAESGGDVKGKGRMNGAVKVAGDIEERGEEAGDSSDFEIIEVPRSKASNGRTSTNDVSDPDLKVQCAICQGDFRNAEMYQHTSRCDGIIHASSKGAWTQIMATGSKTKPGVKNTKAGLSTKKSPSLAVQEKKMPQTSYNGMKLGDLRKLLKDLELPIEVPANEDKATYWKRRHLHWRLLWNANLDLKPDDPHRKTRAELRKELLQWENVQDKSEKVEIRNAGDHQTQYKAQFKLLAENARRTGKASRQETVRADKDDNAEQDVEMAHRSVAVSPPAPATLPAPTNASFGATFGTTEDVGVNEEEMEAESDVEVAQASRSNSRMPSPPSKDPKFVAGARATSPTAIRRSPQLQDDLDRGLISGLPSSASPRSPTPVFAVPSSHVAQGKKRAREHSPDPAREHSPYDPAGPRPSQRVKEQERYFSEDEDDDDDDEEEEGEEGDGNYAMGLQLGALGAQWRAEMGEESESEMGNSSSEM